MTLPTDSELRNARRWDDLHCTQAVPAYVPGPRQQITETAPTATSMGLPQAGQTHTDFLDSVFVAACIGTP